MQHPTERYESLGEVATGQLARSAIQVAVLTTLAIVDHLDGLGGFASFALWAFAVGFLITGRVSAYCVGCSDAFTYLRDVCRYHHHHHHHHQAQEEE